MSFAIHSHGPEKAAADVVELHYANHDGRVVIVPRDKSVMAIPVNTAIEACRAFRHQIEFKEQFDALLVRLAEWIEKHRETLSRAYVTTRDSGLLFLAVMREPQFNPALEDAITDLDVEIARSPDFELIQLSVHIIPTCSELGIKAFLSKDMALQYMIDAK